MDIIGVNQPVWFDLPFEMREMVIDQMDPKSRCRFARCSKMCEIEAKQSDNYLYLINLYTSRTDVLAMDVIFDISNVTGYTLEFMDEPEHNETIVVYRRDRYSNGCIKLICSMQVESGNPKDVRTKYVKEYLEKYKNNIKYFLFYGDYHMLNEINLDNLRKLNEISFIEIPPEFGNVSKLENGFIKIKKLLRVDKIRMVGAKFTFDQVANFRGKKAEISSDEFTEENIKKYLKMWKNGEIHENVEHVQIGIKYLDDITLTNITEGLDVFEYRQLSSFSCSFYSKCSLRENKTFRIVYEPYQLTVEWKDPVQ